MSVFRRSLSLLLALVMVFSCVPVSVFAEQVTGCPHHTTHTDSCGYREAVAGVACGHVCGEDCPTQDVTVCVHDHAASGCTYTEPQEARYCGHTCGDGSCAYAPAVAGVDCTCTPVLTHGETCASLAEGECDCAPTMTHEASCAPVAAQAEVKCDFVHSGCGCADAVTGGWSCAHICTVESGCVKAVCVHACPGDDCGYVAAVSAAPCAYSCGICAVQQLIDALPAEVTQENLESVTAQLTAIDSAKALLSDDDMAQVNFDRYQSAIAAISQLQNQPAAQEPELTDLVTGQCGNDLTWSFNESTGTLTISGTGNMYNNYSPWYEWRTKIKTVVIEEGCTGIGTSAFSTTTDVASITSVSLPSTLKTIGYNAFYANSKLAQVTLPDGLEYIDGYAFGQCDALTSLTIPDSVTTIADRAFVGCDNLASITIGKGLKTLESNIGSIAHVFNNIDGLQTITVSSENPYFTAENNVLYTKDKRTLIAYPMNRAGSDFTVDYNVSSVVTCAFNNPANLKKITFQNSAPSLSDECFYRFTGEVHYDSGNSGWTGYGGKAGKPYGGTILWVDDYNGQNKPVYYSGACGYYAYFQVNLSDNTLTISGTGAIFDYNNVNGLSSAPYAAYASQITSIKVEDGITVIGKNAFRGFTALKSVSLGSTVTEIDNRAFDGCSGLKSIVLPASLMYIREGVFERTGLTSVNLPSNLSYIGASAFKELPITKVTIPSKVTFIGDQAFTQTEGNQTLKTIEFLGAPPTIGGYAFAGVVAEATCQESLGWTASHRMNYGGTLTWKLVGECGSDHSYTYVNLLNGNHRKSCSKCDIAPVTEAHSYVSGVCACGQLSAGQCGDNAYWSYDASTKTLSIIGSGAMYDYKYNETNGYWVESQTPGWYGLNISAVVVEDGITVIGGYAFYNMSLGTVKLADSVTEVRHEAFRGTKATITNSRNLSVVGEGGMAGTSVDKVYVPVSVGVDAFRYTTFTDGNIVVNSNIERYAFFSSNITTLTLTENVKYVRDGSLSGLSDLSAIYFCCNKPDFSNNVYDMGGVTGNTITYYRSSKATGFSDSTAIWEDKVHATVALTPVPATCTQNGYTPYTCPYCSIEVQKDFTAANHAFTYTADDAQDTITVDCKNCDLQTIFTLLPPKSVEYTGYPVKATVKNTIIGGVGLVTPPISYTGSLTDGEPVNTGTYTASISCGNATVSLSFTISKVVAKVTADSVTTTYTSITEALAAANAATGSVLTLLSDLSLNDPLVITGKDVILDLNGKKLTNTTGSGIEVSQGAKLTVQDSGSGGEICGTVDIGFFYKAAIENKGTLILNSGKLSASGVNSPCALMNSGTFIMNGGVLAGKNSISASSGTATFNGGKITAKTAVTGGTMIFHAGDFTGMGDGYIRSGTEVVIYGGKFGILPVSGETTKVTVYNGYFSGQLEASTPTVTLYGGVFARGVKYGSRSIQNMLAEGCVFLDKDGQTMSQFTMGYSEYLSVGSATSQYVAKHYIFSDGTTSYYYDLDTAIDRAERFGGNLTLLRDITNRNQPIVIDAGSFTLDFAGHSITGQINSGALLEIDGCNLLISSGDDKYTLTNTGSGSALHVSNCITLGLGNGTITSGGDAVVISGVIVGMDSNTGIISTNGSGVVLKSGSSSSLVSNGGSITAKKHAVDIAMGSFLIRQNVTLSSDGANVYCDAGLVNLESNNITVKGYTVLTSDTTGKNAFSHVPNDGYTDGVFVPYDSGYTVVQSGSFLYMKPVERPKGTIDYINEAIVGLKPNGEYRINGSLWYMTADENGRLAIREEWIGTDLTITEYDQPAASQTISIPGRPQSPTGITSQDESVYGKHDGALFGVNTTMEYAWQTDDGRSSWNPVTGTNLSNLAPRIYFIRIAATETSFAGAVLAIGITSGKYTAEHFKMTLPTTGAYDGTVRKAYAELPEGLDESIVTYFYNNGSYDTMTPVDVGDYTLTIYISDPHHGYYAVTDPSWSFGITKHTLGIIVEDIADLQYTGEFLYPEAQILFTSVPENCTVEKDRDYTVFYDQNIYPGTAVIRISPVEGSNYTFTAREIPFKILPATIGVEFDLKVGSMVYSGFALEPEYDLTFSNIPDGLTPELDWDYTITYADNIDVGKASVTISPVEGSEYTFAPVKRTFSITPCSVRTNVQYIPDQVYTGSAIEPQVFLSFEGDDFRFPPEQGTDYTITYSNNVNAGTAVVAIAPVEGSNFSVAPAEFTFNILPVNLYSVTIPPIDPQTYTGKAIEPEVNLTFTYQGRPVTLVKDQDYTLTITDNVNAGAAVITVTPVEGGNYTFPETRGGFRIDPVTVVASVGTLGKFLYTGAAVCPEAAVTFSGVPEGLALTAGTDYVVDYRDNVAVSDSAVLEVRPVEGGNFTFETVTSFFSIQYGVALSDVPEALYVDGASAQLEDGILWLKDEKARMVTWYDYANGDSDDMHKIYPTGMHVMSLSFTSEGGYTARRETSLDNLLQYAGTSIRITGNQGIRFITSIPAAKRSSLMGNGLSGYKLVEYGTLMGWYTPGNDLIYGVNAKSVAYDAVKGTNAVFNTTGDVVQFTGMLTNLELEQSTKDLVTRPYMVLERTDASGQKEQVVLYGGSIVRSIGYVAYQNKDVFQPGTASYEFIWNILKYSDPELYEKEHKG